MRVSILLSFLCIVLCAIAKGQDKLYPGTFSIGDVQLLDGPLKHARDLNIKVLLQYDVDRLLAPYRKEAGLTPRAQSYSNWDGLDGHVGGHYLSALAMNAAATGNKACQDRMMYMLAELKACQVANTIMHKEWGNGYVGGVPKSSSIWMGVKKGDLTAYRAAWVPWYNVHKMYAGLRDAWMYTGNEDAKALFLKFCNWAIGITAELAEDQMQSMLDTEHGGMNEIFADAYQLTGDKKYLTAAKRFSHQQLLQPLSKGIDNLDNKHANTQVPKAIGFQRIAELTHESEFKKAGSFFWETVTTNRTLAFGGNSRREFFPSASACGDFIQDVEGPESCNSYNMLKLTEDLFRVSPSAKYIDFYERALFNHILSTQHPVTGGYVYFTPARPRHYKVYSAPNEAMWCCVGSGMENHGKYNQFIYWHQKDSLFVNLFVASELNWKSKAISIRQETTFPYEEKSQIKITAGASDFTMMIRYPEWVKDGALVINVNGKRISYNVHPSSYVAIKRKWKKDDVIQITLPMQNKIVPLPNVPSYIALLHGPILLGARMGTEDLRGLTADASRWGHIANGERLPIDKAPIIIEDNISKITDGLVQVKDKPLTFTFPNVKILNATDNIVLEPFSQIHDARYMVYWMALTNQQYQSYQDSIGLMETRKLALQKRTIDYVAPGEQQPEADHGIQQSDSKTGNRLNEFWRDASANGYFSYNLSTNGETDLSLLIRYWGAEWGSRMFDIYIDDEKLTTENNTGRWNQSRFFDVEYAIPDTMLKGKQSIRVKFQALPQNTAGAVHYIRLVRHDVKKE